MVRTICLYSHMHHSDDLIRRRMKLGFRSHHRGTKEMDVLLGSFAERHIDTFDMAALHDYELLLSEPDPDLYNWITGVDTPPAEKMTPVLKLLMQHRLVK